MLIRINVNICMTMKNKVATTVKVENTLYDEFKVLGVRHKISLQGLVEKTIFRYVNDIEFQTTMNNFIIPVTGLSAVTTSSISN